jgi:D-inositol-3-phosphate glycosyltransferase
MHRLALLSMHGCPVARLGERDTGGMNVYLLRVARELGRLGHIVDVYTRVHDARDAQLMDLGRNARVVHLEAGPYHETKASLQQYIPQFLESLQEFRESEGINYDLVHSHYWLSGLAGMELSRALGVPHATTFHTLARAKMEARPAEDEPANRLAAESLVARSADSIVVSTEQEKGDLGRLYQVSADRVDVVPAGVDLDLFKPMDKAEARRELGLTESKIILSVSKRVEPLKGVDILISAIARLSDISDTRLLVVGGDPGSDSELQRLMGLAADLGVSGSVTFTGAVEQPELPKYYSAADVFVMPSYYETFGLAALEAMACGTPIVASGAAGGPKSFIEEGTTGYLIPWPSLEPYAERLEQLLGDASLRERIGRAARAKALTMGWNTVASGLSRHYDRATGDAWLNAAGE